VSEFDQGKYGKAWLGQVTQLAGVHAALAQATELGHMAERTTDAQTGQVFVTITGNL